MCICLCGPADMLGVFGVLYMLACPVYPFLTLIILTALI